MPREREIKRKKEKEKGGGLKKRKRPDLEVEGLDCEKEKRGKGGCEMQGVGKENCQGKIRVWRLGGLWAGLGYSLANSKYFYFAN